MFPRASRIRPRRLVGFLALASALALSVTPLAQARSIDRPSNRPAATARTAPAEASLFGRFLGLLRAVWQADTVTPPPTGGTGTSAEGSGIDPHGTPKPKP